MLTQQKRARPLQKKGKGRQRETTRVLLNRLDLGVEMASEPLGGLANSKAFQKSFSDIVRAISISDPLKVGDALFTASLVPEETLAKLELPTNTDYMKSRILVMCVMNQVKMVPDKLNEFMEVLQNSIDRFSFQSEFGCTFTLYRRF